MTLASNPLTKLVRRRLRYYGRRYIPLRYASYLRWRNAGVEQGQEAWENWDQRIADVLSCPDNQRIPRVAGAGTVAGGWQKMHNGLDVLVDGYYGAGVTQMLEANKGSHEPQEELVFEAVLSKMGRGAVMIECGAYWAFYSMCMCKSAPGARLYMIEPDLYNLYTGRRNFAQNGFKGTFINAYVGEKPGRADDGAETVVMDEFAAWHGLNTIDILHTDIQGAEVQMLRGTERLLTQKKVRYLFVSTHTQILHDHCLELLRSHGYQIVSSIDLEESFSFDGFIVAARPGEDVGDIPEPAKRTARSESSTPSREAVSPDLRPGEARG